MNAVHDIDKVRGMYGPDSDRDGVLSEHVPLVLRAGGFVRVGPTGIEWAGFTGGKHMLPVLCSELVQGRDAEGVPQSARCGYPVVPGTPWCQGHEMADEDEMDEMCEHGMAAWLCAGPSHYPMD